jgi:hypothetical protein
MSSKKELLEIIQLQRETINEQREIIKELKEIHKVPNAPEEKETQESPSTEPTPSALGMQRRRLII